MSEKNLEGLITTLKKEAIQEAENQAGQILANARQEAKALLEQAAITKEEMLGQAEAEAKATRDKGESALRQAARDLSVTVQKDLLTLLKNVLEREVESTFTTELIQKAVLIILENVGSGVSIALSRDLGKQLADQILHRLQDSQELVSISRDTSLVKGFTISKSDEGWVYQVSPEEVTEVLHTYLAPKWVSILKKNLDT